MVGTKFLRDKYAWLFCIYIIVLALFASLSHKIIFHDTWEYIMMAKNFAGYLNSNAFSVHSLLYPFFLSLFTRWAPSLLTLKLVNLSWVVLIGFLLYKSEARKTAFLVWVFSPIAWMSSIVISPIILASFLLLIAYLSIKKWQEGKKNTYFIISALALGLAAAFYDLAIFLAMFFVLAFFYDKKFKEAIFYLLFVFLSFSTRLVLDASLFSLIVGDKILPFPIYSLIRFFGAMLIINLGLHPAIPVSKLVLFRLSSWYFLVLISPLLFYLHKISYKKNKNVIIFLILSTILFIFQGGGHLYFLTLAPIAIVLLSKTFKRKELLIHILISCFLIFIMVKPYFIQDIQEIEKRNLIINDLKLINRDFSFDATVFDTETLAMFYIWDKGMPYLVSSEEYNKVLQNDLYYTYYPFEVKSKINTQKILELKAGLKTNIKEGVDYKNLPWLLEKGKAPPEGYKLTKCYTSLCVYEKNTIS